MGIEPRFSKSLAGAPLSRAPVYVVAVGDLLQISLAIDIDGVTRRHGWAAIEISQIVRKARSPSESVVDEAARLSRTSEWQWGLITVSLSDRVSATTSPHGPLPLR